MVVAIIALLAALLLPALKQARATARASVCLSNQRQLALGMLSFAGDKKPLAEQTAELDKRSKKIEDWLAELKAAKK